MATNTMTVTGNLARDPELRYTPTGAAVATFTVASTPRFMDKTTSEWKDGDTLWLNCTIWRQAAENVAESLQKGSAVIVTGKLKQRSYETKEGEKRTVFELDVDDIGPSLRNASAKITRSERSQPGNGGGYGGGQQARGDDPWASTGSGVTATDGQPGAFTDEPPF